MIEIKDLEIKVDLHSKSWFESAFKYSVIKDMNLTIDTGSVVAIVGVNGAGKSTLLKAMAHILRPANGSVDYDDVKNNKRFNESVVYMSEENTFLPDYSALDNGEFFDDFYPNFDIERFKRLLVHFSVNFVTPACKLSRGEQSKLEMSIGLAKGGKYLLMDEPFLGADICTRRDFMKLMIDFLRGDETIIISSHDISDIERFADRVIVLDSGKIVEDIDMTEFDEGNLHSHLIKTFDDLAKTKVVLTDSFGADCATPKALDKADNAEPDDIADSPEDIVQEVTHD